MSITLEEPLTMTYSLRYFTLFTKAACLSNRVTISLGNDVPAAVEFKIDDSAGYVRFYLAPKIEDDSWKMDCAVFFDARSNCTWFESWSKPNRTVPNCVRLCARAKSVRLADEPCGWSDRYIIGRSIRFGFLRCVFAYWRTLSNCIVLGKLTVQVSSS